MINRQVLAHAGIMAPASMECSPSKALLSWYDAHQDPMNSSDDNGEDEDLDGDGYEEEIYLTECNTEDPGHRLGNCGTDNLSGSGE